MAFWVKIEWLVAGQAENAINGLLQTFLVRDDKELKVIDACLRRDADLV